MSSGIMVAVRPSNLKITIAEGLVAACAAAVILQAGLFVWVMFLGWISYFTCGLTIKDGLVNFAGVLIGLMIGLGAGTVLSLLGPEPSLFEQVSVIFGVAMVVLSFRFLPSVNNLLAFFLGLVTFFAAHTEPTLSALLPLAAASGIGAAAGAAAHKLQLWLQHAPSPTVIHKEAVS